MAGPYIGYVLTTQAEKEARMISRRQIRDACNPFELPDNEFRRIYRMPKEMGVYICDELENQLQAKRRDGLPVHIKVLTCIRLMADGSYQRGTGQDHNLCIAQTTVSKYLREFCDVFMRQFMNNWIVFPGTSEARQRIANAFLAKFNIPNILGTIDCTHMTIFPPPLPHGVQYLNRKGVHSLNVQLVADVDCRIISVNARYPGRVHDQFIFNNSNVKTEMRRLYDERIGEYFLLGDSGYALEPWLMTPILNAAPNSPEERYTSWHCLVRNGIERTNGYLKGVFRILGLDRTLHYDPEMSSKIIYCCCILYNMLKHFRFPIEQEAEPEMEADRNDIDPNPPQGLLLRVAEQKRANLVRNHFTQ